MNTIYKKYGKRIIDVLMSLMALIILSPVLLIVTVLIFFKLGSPVLFTQKRPGKNEKVFKMYKFRSMTNERDESGNLLPDSKRLPKFGQMLRSTSLDELPGLWNILKGDMSIVGPRPLLVQYLPLYNKEQSRRHEVRPGLTGYAQVNGRNTLRWQERFKLDVEYIQNISFLLDVKIILQTVKKVFIKEGISSGTSQTMEAFKGNEYEQ